MEEKLLYTLIIHTYSTAKDGDVLRHSKNGWKKSQITLNIVRVLRFLSRLKKQIIVTVYNKFFQ